MPKESITDCIFNWKQLNHLFNMNDQELKEIDTKMSEADEILYKFINKKVHPKIRKKLIKLIGNSDNNLVEYCNRESQIHYNAGFTDGIALILSILFP